MSLSVKPTAIPEVLIVTPSVFDDERGFFAETYHVDKYASVGVSSVFAQDNHSRSHRDVLRGLHYQRKSPQAKLVWVARGSIFDVAVDMRRGSSTFGHWVGRILTDKNREQLFIPAGFAHGFCTLSSFADVQYKCDSVYDPQDNCGIRWDDPTLAITWPVVEPIVSDKDRCLPYFADLPLELFF